MLRLTQYRSILDGNGDSQIQEESVISCYNNYTTIINSSFLSP